MRHGDLLLLASIVSAVLVVMFVIYTIIFSQRKTNRMDDIYRNGAVSPNGPEWTTGKCEKCGNEKPLHVGYGQCYACIHEAC